jgi:hypothetical protein
MKRKILKWVLGVVLTPVVIFITLMVALYVPAVQNFIRQKAVVYASDATGMDISVGRIDLRFPLNLLVRDVCVVDHGDTLLSLGSLNTRIQAMPLLHAEVEIDEITLKDADVNTLSMIEGMNVKGKLGYIHLESHGIDLSDENAIINNVELSDTDLSVTLCDTTTTEENDTTSALAWKFNLQSLTLSNVAVDLNMPNDSLRLHTHLAKLGITDVHVDLGNEEYSMQRLLLQSAMVRYDSGNGKASPGLDPSHIVLNNINVDIDSLYYKGRDINAVINQCSMDERSGISITSLTGTFHSDSTTISMPSLSLHTPHSEINLTAKTYWKLIDMPTTSNMAVWLDAKIGKQDVMLMAGDLPQDFKDAYPFRPFILQAGTEGNLREMQISRLHAELPGAFTVDGSGDMYNLSDSLKRYINVDLNMETKDINFLTALAGLKPNGEVVIPNNIKLDANVHLEGQQLETSAYINESNGEIDMDAKLNLASEDYSARVDIKNFHLQHFLPHDSIYDITASARALGKGLDINKKSARANITADVTQLGYKTYNLSNIKVDGTLSNSVAKANITSDNILLNMKGTAEYDLSKNYPCAAADIDVFHVGFYELGLIPKPASHDLTFCLQANVDKHEIYANMTSEDMSFRMNTDMGVYELTTQVNKLINRFEKQMQDKSLDLDALRELLPTANIEMKAGNNNILAWYLETNDIHYKQIAADFNIEPINGLNGHASIYTLKVDTLQLDTIYFTARQDTGSIVLNGGVINNADNPHIAFNANLSGHFCNDDAELTLQYIDDKGDTGLLLGVNAKPLFEGHGKGNGIVFSLLPEEPVIAYRQFKFVDNDKWIYLHHNNRVYANVNMNDSQGVGIQIQSLPTDTVSLQNIDVELRNIELGDIFKLLPYMPSVTGLMTADVHFIQTKDNLQLSAETMIDKMTYERRPVGDIAVGATWLPGDAGEQYVNAYVAHNDNQVLQADGIISPTAIKKDSIGFDLTMHEFPMSLANIFIPAELATMSGDICGELNAHGYLESPIVNGSVSFDSLKVNSAQYGVKFSLDNAPLKVIDNRMLFDNFAIYASGDSPFTINGYVDMHNYSNPTVNLKLNARNYMLLDAKRTRESLLYGKIALDMNASLTGAADALVMRGNMSVLGNTDVTYVLTDSPLTVQDRLGELVTFTNFADTTNVEQQDINNVSLGGLDMVMSVTIDPLAQLRADLSTDRSSRILLQGGGNLSLKYTPQGDLSLTGRYTLTGGTIKYSLPVIPLKEFQILSDSYVEWTGDPMDPILNLKATEKLKASVADDDGSSRLVQFEISVVIKNTLDDLTLAFEIDAPDDSEIQNQLAMMGEDERQKNAVAMLATGIYLADSGTSNFNMSSALNSVLSSQINNLMGNINGANLSVGIDNNNNAGSTQTDYSFSYSQRFFNDRFQIVIGGKVSTGSNVTNDAESFIDNVRLEYRLDNSGTRYLQLFYDKNYESVLDGEVTEAGVGVVLRKKMDKLRELFIFNTKWSERRKQKKLQKLQKQQEQVKESEKDETQQDNI